MKSSFYVLPRAVCWRVSRRPAGHALAASLPLARMQCLLFGFIAISVHAFVVMFMHQLGVPQPMQAAPAWRSASRKAESRHPQSRTMEAPPVGRKIDESVHARERDDFAALRKDMRQLISRLSQHLDLLEQPRTAPPAAAAREPEPVQSAAGAAATLRTDKVGLTLAQAVQAMVRDAMLAEDAGRVEEEEVERPAAAGASLQPRLEQLTARLARAEAEARELGELQARAEAELRELEASRRRAQRRAEEPQAEAKAEQGARAAGVATGGATGAAGAAGATLEQLLETLRAGRPAASPKPTTAGTTAGATEAAAAPAAADKPLSAKPAAAAPRRKPKKEKEASWEAEWEKEDEEASRAESGHARLTAEMQAMLAKLMGADGGGGGGGSRGESKASTKKKKGKKAEQAKGGRAAPEDGAAAASEQSGAKGQAAARARAIKDDFEVHDVD